MQFVTCQFPKTIVNRYTKERLVVPCGRCFACRNLKSLDFVNRLTLESNQHLFTYFFTLTYDDRHLPKAYLSKNNGSALYFYNPNTKNKFEGQLFLYTSAMQQHFIEVLPKVGRSNFVPYASKKDLQNFFKRLRKKVEKVCPEAANKIRYFAVSEFGKLHLRPHFHGVLWFDSFELAGQFISLFYSCWSFGRSDVQLSRDRCAEYVSKYINSINVYPELYSFANFKPFYLSSRRPAIGCFRCDKKALQEQIKRTNFVDIIERPKTLSSVTVSRAFKDRFFPKCREFSRLSYSGQLSSYNISTKVEFERIGDDDKLKRDWYISNRVVNLAKAFGVSLAYYVILIRRFYDKLSQFNLKLFYEFQQDFARRFGAFPLLCLYPLALQDFLQSYNDGNLERCAFVLSCFSTEDYVLNDDFISKNFDLSSNESVFNYFLLQRKISEDSVKTRLVNELLKPF